MKRKNMVWLRKVGQAIKTKDDVQTSTIRTTHKEKLGDHKDKNTDQYDFDWTQGSK
jgi:hypothetical protein